MIRLSAMCRPRGYGLHAGGPDEHTPEVLGVVCRSFPRRGGVGTV